MRGYNMFVKPLCNDFKGLAELCGVFDINGLRAKLASEKCGGVKIYEDFETMLLETKPDAVIIATIDCEHHYYAIKAMEMGYDVITEKPMTIDVEKCKAILDAEKRTGKRVIVTFNCRFMPVFSKIKELMVQKTLGEVHSVHLEWLLDTVHGASYFHRWHKHMEKSGGLLVHKATHHFDIVNWFLDDTPKSVSAFGALNFYGPTRAERGERCLTCAYGKTCEFYFDIATDPTTKELYYESESADGYIWDGCVFSDDIDIFDTMSLNVQYEKGAQLSYSLKAYAPYEGWKLSIIGSNGRLEAEQFSSGTRINERYNQIRIFDLSGNITTHDVLKSGGGHGGGDERLLQMLIVGGQPDVLNCMASSIEGAKSLLVGACANISIKKRKMINIKEEIIL